MENKYQETEILEADDAADLLLAAIIEGQLETIQDNVLIVELELMENIAIKRAGSEALVHWSNLNLH